MGLFPALPDHMDPKGFTIEPGEFAFFAPPWAIGGPAILEVAAVCYPNDPYTPVIQFTNGVAMPLTTLANMAIRGDCEKHKDRAALESIITGMLVQRLLALEKRLEAVESVGAAGGIEPSGRATSGAITGLPCSICGKPSEWRSSDADLDFRCNEHCGFTANWTRIGPEGEDVIGADVNALSALIKSRNPTEPKPRKKSA